jgi:hypothetical protein
MEAVVIAGVLVTCICSCICLSLILLVYFPMINRTTYSSTKKPINVPKTVTSNSSNLIITEFEGMQEDKNVSVTCGNQVLKNHVFIYGTERSEGTAIFETVIFTFAGSGPRECSMKLSGKWRPINPYIGCGGVTVKFNVVGDTITFTLPETNVYFYKADIQSKQQTPTIHLKYDPLSVVTPPPGARIIKRGVYNQATLEVKTGETVFMEPGTIIKCNQNGDAFLKMGDNSSLIGSAIIDTDNRTSNICHIKSSNVNILGVSLRKSINFAYVAGGRNVVANHISVFGGVDGADPIAATGYVMKNSAVVSVDDCWAVKSHRGDVNNVLIEGCICTSRKSAFKYGTESTNPYNNITFRNCTLYDGCRFIALYLVDGGSVRGAKFQGMLGFLISWPNENRSGRWLDTHGTAVATIKREQKNSPIFDCLIEDCVVYGAVSADITATGTPTNITCKNVKLYPPNEDLWKTDGKVNLIRE